MKKLIGLVIIAFAFSSCYTAGEALHGGYGQVNKKCPTLNQNAFFYKAGTGKAYTFRNVMRTTKQH